jgi:hypothetical protein
MFFEASFPPAGVLGAYCADIDDEVNEFGLNGYGCPWVIIKLKTNAG